MKTIKETFETGFKNLAEMAKNQPKAQQDMFFKLAENMSELAGFYDTLPENRNYEAHGYEFLNKKGINGNDAKVVVMFTSQAIKLGRGE